MSDRTYNGWTNYETWAVGMYLDGNYTGEGTYLAVRDLVEEVAPNGKFRVADSLKDWTEGHIEAEHETSGIVADLVGAALSEVDWEELAEAQLSALVE
jgi:hypothetical protein